MPDATSLRTPSSCESAASSSAVQPSSNSMPMPSRRLAASSSSSWAARSALSSISSPVISCALIGMPSISSFLSSILFLLSLFPPAQAGFIQQRAQPA